MNTGLVHLLYKKSKAQIWMSSSLTLFFLFNNNFFLLSLLMIYFSFWNFDLISVSWGYP